MNSLEYGHVVKEHDYVTNGLSDKCHLAAAQSCLFLPSGFMVGLSFQAFYGLISTVKILEEFTILLGLLLELSLSGLSQSRNMQHEL